jgi:F0F1-type ATP synthase alpha subunit
MDIRAAEISKVIKDQIANFGTEAEVSETGQVLSVGDGIARIYVGTGRTFPGLLDVTNDRCRAALSDWPRGCVVPGNSPSIQTVTDGNQVNIPGPAGSDGSHKWSQLVGECWDGGGVPGNNSSV